MIIALHLCFCFDFVATVMQISLLYPLGLCLLCLSTVAQSWISHQDQVCTIDPVAIVTALFQLQLLRFYVHYKNLYLGQYFN